MCSSLLVLNRPDHPRSRGVYTTDSSIIVRAPGSSPLARGLPGYSPQRSDNPGIIPARAGFTWRCAGRMCPAPDHPRSRGVYPASATGPPPSRGSSPLARGLRWGPGAVRQWGRIIPARAGFTTALVCGDRGPQDHPRSRGVYAAWRIPPAKQPGSSPLARGLPQRGVRSPSFPGIIPARAGFTAFSVPVMMRRRDHPRSRGVYENCTLEGVLDAGSSPLARGLLPPVVNDGGAARIIPARAGFTGPAPVEVRREPDHPRSRGVYAAPRLWEGAGSRIIPARAGFTDRVPPGLLLARDHPRSRGVYPGPEGPGC